jgi:hypothetical protein
MKITQLNIPIEPITMDDLDKIKTVLLTSVNIIDLQSENTTERYKEEVLDAFATLLKKILFNDSDMSSEEKLNVISLLAKVNRQQEVLEIIRSKTSAEDLLIASERLSKKSQSAFELK